MNLKHTIFSLILFLLLPAVASAQQATKADIQILLEKMNVLDNKVTEMDKRLTNQITEMDKQLTNQITETNARLTDRIDNLDKRLTAEIRAVQTTTVELDKRLTSRIDTLYWVIGGLIGVVLTVIALPQVFGYFQERRTRSDFERRIGTLEERIQQQEREIEELKSRRIVTPS
jgi:predicted PurR-regulated permease PerM